MGYRRNLQKTVKRLKQVHFCILYWPESFITEFNLFFLSAVWLPHDQLWSTIELTASLKKFELGTYQFDHSGLTHFYYICLKTAETINIKTKRTYKLRFHTILHELVSQDLYMLLQYGQLVDQHNNEHYDFEFPCRMFWNTETKTKIFKPFFPYVIFLYPLKISENHKSFWYFR